MEYFSYNGKCGICVSRCLKEELAWAPDKRFWFASDVMLLKAVIPARKALKNTLKLLETILHTLLCGP